MVNHPNRSKRPKWLPLAMAPNNVIGLLWGPELRDRTDLTGQVRVYPDGERVVSCSGSPTATFTHWHPLPDRPKTNHSGYRRG